MREFSNAFSAVILDYIHVAGTVHIMVAECSLFLQAPSQAK